MSGSNSVVESQPSKLLVAGSNPVSRSIKINNLQVTGLALDRRVTAQRDLDLFELAEAPHFRPLVEARRSAMPSDP
jgi:hypothetical protein